MQPRSSSNFFDQVCRSTGLSSELDVPPPSLQCILSSLDSKIKRGGIETQVKTPRFTTVFGIDSTSRFDGSGDIIDATTRAALPFGAYTRYAPRPLPQCLDDLRRSAEQVSDSTGFNFCLVNYYASGVDSIAFHSDDERFLGADPCIASFSLGARRDFLLRRKPASSGSLGENTPPQQIKLPLGSGDMILMRGKTQSCWMHSVPKRTGKNENDGGRINITFRKALIKPGTDNYYHYNVGTGPVYKWDDIAREMMPWKEKA
jgi:hypothetical protein